MKGITAMRVVTSLCVIASLCVVARAGDDADRAKLVGTWQAEKGADAVSWVLAVQGNSMKVTQFDGGSKVAEFVCGTDGSPCEIQAAGKRATVSMWFNGPKLVELETKGSDVVERRFSPVSDAGGMQLEVVPIAPSGETQTLKFKRSTPAAAKR
jgi:hypothetical protein